ncbi:MAG: GNAT family N-acetyltransferase [Gemmatimonadota bacterium]
MVAWLPDRSVRGPERPTIRDIEPLNRIFAEAFTDRYRRDGLVGVRVPYLNPLIWRYAIEDSGEGAMIWRDGDGRPAAFNMVHQSGSEGWMGPLAVRPDRQNEGLGKAVVRAGIEWLRARGARTIGLETMPRTVDNIGFYSRLEMIPRHLTVTLSRDIPKKPGDLGEMLSWAGTEYLKVLAECRELSKRLSPGIDFTRELQLTLDLQIGDTSLVRRDGHLVGFALWHSAPLAEGRPRDEVRVLKLVAQDMEAFDAVIRAVQAATLGEGLRRISVRCQTAFGEAYTRLVGEGYRVHWTDLRMTLNQYPEPEVSTGVVWSNWEI